MGNVLTINTPGNNATIFNMVDQGVTTTFNYTSDPGDATHNVPAYSQAAALGQPLTVTDNKGKVTHYHYNAQGLPLSVFDALGHETDYGDATSAHAGGYNLADQPLLVTLPATDQTGAGRATRVSAYLYPGGPLTQETAYDESGNQVRQIAYTYDPEGQTRQVTGSTQPVNYTYDALYRLKTLTDGGGHTTRYYYNPEGYLASVLYPAGDTLQFPAYDPAGNVLKRLDGRGVETDYVYNDPESLLTAIQYPGNTGLNVAYGYDTYGRRAGMTDGTGGSASVYDDLDNLISATTTYTGLPAETVSYAYFPDGSRQSMTTPAGTFGYSYDVIGQLTGLTDPFRETTTLTYQDNGWPQSRQLSDGVTTTYTLNPQGLVTDLLNKAAGGATLSDFGGMTYDGVGNRTGVTATMPGLPSSYSGTTGYLYDTQDRLLQEQSTRWGGYTNSFAYDGAGNPTTFRGGANGFNADNQNSGFTYDGNGNPITYNGVSLSYDPENRLVTTGH